jgi:dTDP-4-dehydrorhamnose 3,5-epimerase
MIFRETGLDGAWLIDLEKRSDDRGFFARLFCKDEFRAAGLETDFSQINTSLSTTAGTLRGMHYQLPPASEVKVVRCVRGELWDCIVDLRPDSSTYKKWFGATLSAANRTMMYVPKGFAHGFITLSDEAEALYLVGASYSPEKERGLHWSDPAIGIEWPRTPSKISAKDDSWRHLDPNWHGVEAFRSAAVFESESEHS